ncbi:MAG TPA: hypothetical protein VNX21_02100 [Candidatus Thermoplasmatota archaeon]|nr:hypothetical protein [Candidatus Thermoplasmatota archaeon]
MRVHAMLLGILLLPLAAAAPSTVRGAFTADALHAQGEARLDASDGYANVTTLLAAGAALAWGAAQGWEVRYAWTNVYPPVGEPVKVHETPTNRSLDAGPGRVARVACGPACSLVLLALDEGALALHGRADGALPAAPRDVVVHAAYAQAGQQNAFSRTYAAGAVDAARAFASPRVEAGGHVGLLVKDARVEVALADGGILVVDARHDRRPLAGSAPGERVDSAFAYLRMRDAAFAADGAPEAFLAQSGLLRVAGRVEAVGASGWAEHRDERRAFEDARVVVEGDARLALAPAPRPTLGLGPAALAAELEGEAERVRVDGALVMAPLVRATGTAAAGLGAGGLLALLLLSRAAVPLYSRVTRSRVLANANRRRAYDAVRAARGVTIAELARSMGVARVVVLHHLRMLEAHRLVRSELLGRSRVYYVPEALQDGRVLQWRAHVADPMRRTIAAVVLARGGASQRDIMGATGASQRLVSYHLSRLEQARLVRGEGSLPRRYHPTDELRAALAEA